jgi:hypothetical protein
MPEAHHVAVTLVRLLLVSSAIVPACQSALAQNSTAPRPLLGTVPTQGSAQSGNRERVSIEPSVVVSYDSNILRRNPDVISGPTDNTRTTPALSLGYNRQVGRTQFRVGASVGYDLNSRFSYLNRARIGARGGVTWPVGAQCPLSLSYSYQQSQYDLEDTEEVVASVQRLQQFGADISCSRPGITPNLGTTYRTSRNSGFDFGDSNYVEAHAGVRLSVPSIGALTFNGQLAKITRPNTVNITGIEDNTDIKRFYVALDRSVAPRFRISGTFGIVHAAPNNATVPDFTGPSYSAEIGYSFTPRIRLTVNGSGDVQESTGVAATYVVRRELRAALDVDVFNRTTVGVSGSYLERRFERSDSLADTRIGADQSQRVSLRINREIGRRLRLGLTGSILTRDADVDYYDFDSASVSVSLSSRF